MGRVTNCDGCAGWCNKFTLLCINKICGFTEMRIFPPLSL